MKPLNKADIINLCDELSEKPAKSPSSPKKNLLEQDTSKVEYERQTLQRLEKLIDLRSKRDQYKKQKEERRRQRKELREQQKAAQSETNNNNNNNHRPQSLPRQLIRPSNYNNGPSTSNGQHANMIVDLTDVCDRRSRPELHSVKVQRWKSSFKEEIPVIVDVSNRNRPKQIFDLTKLSEPALPPPPSPPQNNQRLERLRQEREQRYNDFTETFGMLAHSQSNDSRKKRNDRHHKSKKHHHHDKKHHDKKKPYKQQRDKEVVVEDDKLVMYHSMMEKVTRNLNMNFCGSRVSV